MKEQLKPNFPEKEPGVKKSIQDILGTIELALNFEPTSEREKFSILDQLPIEISQLQKQAATASQEDKIQASKILLELIASGIEPELQKQIAEILIIFGQPAVKQLDEQISNLTSKPKESKDDEEERIFQLFRVIDLIDMIAAQKQENLLKPLVPKLAALLNLECANRSMFIHFLESLGNALAKVGNLAIKPLSENLNNDPKLTREKIRQYAHVLNKVLASKDIKDQEKEAVANIYIRLLRGPEANAYFIELGEGLAIIGEPAIEPLLKAIADKKTKGGGVPYFTAPLGLMADHVSTERLIQILPQLENLFSWVESEFINKQIGRPQSEYIKEQLNETIEKIKSRLPKAA